MSYRQNYDVIIVGSGAGGSTLAYALASTGKRILVLERGNHITREKENWDANTVFIEKRYHAKEVWYDKYEKPFVPGMFYNVGGNTRFFGASLFRLRKEDFGELRHHSGISPAWPVPYEVFEPYYTKAEELFAVHGKRGSDPTEPPASGPYPHPPVSHEPYVESLAKKFAMKGYHPFPMPLGIRLNEQDKTNSECCRCDTCDAFPCLIGAKSDAYTSALRPALKHSNVTLLTNVFVESLETSPSGREITKVIAFREGELLEFSGNVVVIACGAVNTAALLLRSVSDTYPYGLGNNNKIVGRHYMGHGNSTWILAISQNPNPTNFPKTLAIHDFYFGEESFPFPMGAIQTVGKVSGTILKTKVPGVVPRVILNGIAEHSIAISVTSEDLPLAENKVTLTSEGKIRLHYTIHNRAGHDRLVAKLLAILKEFGYYNLTYKLSIGDVAHQCGTARFGTDPKTSVLDAYCRVHDVDNLYVVDASFFVSSAAVNPALTIVANALRIGEHLVERFKS
jgi:choline dehydrogenase-like flavoprotein